MRGFHFQNGTATSIVAFAQHAVMTILPLHNFGSKGPGRGQFDGPHSVAVTRTSKIVISDYLNHRIQILDASGQAVRTFGSCGVGLGQLVRPVGVAVDADNRIVVVDEFNHRVQIFDEMGVFQMTFGVNGSGDGQFSYPDGIAIDPVTQRIYVSDFDNRRVQVFTRNGRFVRKFGGPTEMIGPVGMALYGGMVYVSDTKMHCVHVYTEDGRKLKQLGREGDQSGQFQRPYGLTVDKYGLLYVCDRDNGRLQVFEAATGRLKETYTGQGHTTHWLEDPLGVAVLPKGRVVVTDFEHDLVHLLRWGKTMRPVVGSEDVTRKSTTSLRSSLVFRRSRSTSTASNGHRSPKAVKSASL